MFVRVTEHTQLDETQFARMVSDIRGMAEYLGLGSWQEIKRDGEIWVGTGAVTLLRARPCIVFGHQMYSVAHTKFYPEHDPCIKNGWPVDIEAGKNKP